MLASEDKGRYFYILYKTSKSGEADSTRVYKRYKLAEQKVSCRAFIKLW
jgi:hypothetical protein